MANTTLNPVDKAAGITLTGSNLIARNNNNAISAVRGVHGQTSGAFYWEYTANVWTYSRNGLGVGLRLGSLSSRGDDVGSFAIAVRTDGSVWIDGTSARINIGAITAGATICIAGNFTSQMLYFRLGAAGLWNGLPGVDPTTDTGGIPHSYGGFPLYPFISLGNTNDQATANFGDSAFVGAIPSGFTAGFPTSTVPTAGGLTQIASEQILLFNPEAQMTLIGVEQFTNVGGMPTQGIMTLIGIEQWASVRNVSLDVPTQARAMILA